MTLALAILVSGRGSNMRAIHRAILDDRLDAKITLVLSNQKNAEAIRYASEQGLPVAILPKLPNETRQQYDGKMIEHIEKAGANWVVLAGFMRLLSPEFVERFRGRLINIHPSLLPKFPGLNAQRQALEAGERQSGCTVHFVDEGCDTGPIIAQRSVPVLPNDDEASLAARILEQEHQLYPEVLQKIAEGKIALQGGKVLTR